MPREWTKEEERYLKGNYEQLTNAQLAEALGVSAKSVEAKLRRLKLKRKRKRKPKAKVRKETVARMVKAPEDPRRTEAVQVLDQALKLWVEGRDNQAMEQLKKITSEYSSVLDVVWAAKQYLERCRALGKEG